MFTGYLFVLLNALGALPLGVALGVALVCGHSGLTPRDVARATIDSAWKLWDRIASDATPGERVDAALRTAAPAPAVPTVAELQALLEPVGDVVHPLAPTLDDLADDAAADPICAAVLTGQGLDLNAHRGLTARAVVQHLESHGRTHTQALDQAAGILGVRPVALERILIRSWQRPTTDLELADVLPGLEG